MRLGRAVSPTGGSAQHRITEQVVWRFTADPVDPRRRVAWCEALRLTASGASIEQMMRSVNDVSQGLLTYLHAVRRLDEVVQGLGAEVAPPLSGFSPHRRFELPVAWQPSEYPVLLPLKTPTLCNKEAVREALRSCGYVHWRLWERLEVFSATGVALPVLLPMGRPLPTSQAWLLLRGIGMDAGEISETLRWAGG